MLPISLAKGRSDQKLWLLETSMSTGFQLWSLTLGQTGPTVALTMQIAEFCWKLCQTGSIWKRICPHLPNTFHSVTGGPYSEQALRVPITRIPVGEAAETSLPSILSYCLASPGVVKSVIGTLSRLIMPSFPLIAHLSM